MPKNLYGSLLGHDRCTRYTMTENVVKEYFTHSQFHGLRFVADFRRHWVERLFWFICICISWYGCFLLILSSWESYVNNPLSFGAETTYLNWNTSFFSVTVCEHENLDLIEDRADELFGEHDWNLNDIIKEISFFKGNAYTASEYCNSGDIECPRTGIRQFALKAMIEDKRNEKKSSKFGVTNFIKKKLVMDWAQLIWFLSRHRAFSLQYRNLSFSGSPGSIRFLKPASKPLPKQKRIMFRSKCEEIFKSCSWMGKDLNCCRYFRLLETELGPCYSLNSIQVRKPKPISLISNKITGPGALTIELFTTANVYIHSPEDVPLLNTIAAEVVEARKGTYNLVEYGITEIVNEAEVKRVDIARRRCRYPEENDLKVYNRYSYTACVTECRAKKQMKLCNCTSHFTPEARNDSICDIDGLLCLDSKAQDLTFLINPWSNKIGLICSCFPGCAGTEFDLVKLTTSEINASYAIITLTIDRLPSVKLKRSVVRSDMDLVVSMGGTVGLFVGASLLSFVEIIYFFTLRLYGTIKMRKEKKILRMEHT